MLTCLDRSQQAIQERLGLVEAPICRRTRHACVEEAKQALTTKPILTRRSRTPFAGCRSERAERRSPDTEFLDPLWSNVA